jgi:bilirubin oxidase
MLWYHDHAIDHVCDPIASPSVGAELTRYFIQTAENAYFGQAGVYILHDPAEDSLGLPSGYGKYDIPLVLSAKQYNSDGTLFSPASETTSLYGDVIHVNGQPWPYLVVEPRKYRFRFLDAAISRTFQLYLERDLAVGTQLLFSVIASDAGLLSNPVGTKDLYISMAERWEIVMDFAPFAGQNVTLRNTKGFAADTDYLHTDKVMKFVVGNTVSNPSNNGDLPPILRSVPFPKDKTGVDHHFRFESTNGQWKINGVTFNDVANRVLAKPPCGTIEVWELENSSGGWTHPIHIHLIDMKVVKRTGSSRGVQPYEAVGLKDVVWLGPGETVTVEAHYAPWDGVYMFHCHNLIHEDHAMMAAFNVSVLEDLGYNETHYIDPMEQRWRAKLEDPADFTDAAIEQRIQFMASFQPYNKVAEVFSVLDDYWKTKTAAITSISATVPAPTAVPTTTTAPTTTLATTTKLSTSTTTTKTTTTKTSSTSTKT